jgi:hypothetical protein
MAIVRFASLCDYAGCGKRAEEYTAWPTCRECLDDFCPDHYVPGSKTDPDLDAPEKCLCRACAAAEAV